MNNSPFAHLVGNENVKSYLNRIVERQAVGHSFLFAGPEGIGKAHFATAFAKLLYSINDPLGIHAKKIESGNHPDVHWYRPEGKTGMHSILAMRQFSEDVHMAPFEGKLKIFIIDEAERMLPTSANALLKTFEEPAMDTVIILISSAPSALLPTVLSRCRVLRFHPISPENIAFYITKSFNVDEQTSLKIALMSHGSLSKALHLLQEGEMPMRSKLLNILASGGFSSYKQLTTMAAQIVDSFDETKKEIEDHLRSSITKGYEFTAQQKQALDKEIEGSIATHIAQEANRLFDVIVGWYRDLQLVRVNGDHSYLIHPDYKEACLSAFQSGAIKSLETVQKALLEARLSLQRSTPIQTCFETLFLKLDLLK